MKFAVLAVVICAMVAVDGAPSKRLLDFGGLTNCPVTVMCFINPCMLSICPGNPGATCKQGCACSAVWTDVLGNTVTC
ncbi:hypothetical protein SNE40_012225 [Patella caerulea]|uniref:Uncharacterized protein n=1 Tax=Patella caerulea TaxID=87958 RepID=A0AAN8PLK4_PATCE